jgi:glycosyltransferase involved in cell wall biosynthesis
MFLSIVTPTYNRSSLLLETIQSTIDSIKSIKEYDEVEIELIIVDDGSSDGTYEKLSFSFMAEIQSGFIRYLRLDINSGVTVAKNYGALNAQGEWIMFLDSDDLLIPNQFSNLLEVLKKSDNFPAVFFKCINFNGDPIGKLKVDSIIDLKSYINYGIFGERLPVIKRQIIIKFPYENELRGFEGLAYFRMLASGLNFYLSELIIRRYRTDNNDRLSLGKSRLKRAHEMKMGYKLLLNEYQKLRIKPPYKVLLKFYFYKSINRIRNLIY